MSKKSCLIDFNIFSDTLLKLKKTTDPCKNGLEEPERRSTTTDDGDQGSSISQMQGTDSHAKSHHKAFQGFHFALCQFQGQLTNKHFASS